MRLRIALTHRRLAGTHGNARTQWVDRESVLVRLESGLGEAAPVPGHSAETAAEAFADLARLGPFVDLPPPAADLRAWLATASAACATSAARFALESALVDLVGQWQGVPAHALLGAQAAEVDVAAVISGEPAAWPAQVERLAAAGYRHFKFKVDPATLGAALEALRLLRRSMPDAVVRIDANQTLHAAPVPGWHALAEVGPEFIEEPVPPEFLPPRPGVTPLALDESLVGHAGWRGRIADGTYGVVVLKPSVVGGLVRAMDLAAEVRALGAAVVVSYGWESVVGWSAACAVARALGAQQRPAGLAPHAGMTEAAVIQTHLARGRLRLPGEPGLGLGGLSP